MIPKEVIDEIFATARIEEVIGEFVQLKKSGRNYKGLSPFVQEKTPSFSVSPSKQFYHCFGCGAHGSAISFLIDHDGLNFIDSVHELAKVVSLTVPDHVDEKPENRK